MLKKMKFVEEIVGLEDTYVRKQENSGELGRSVAPCIPSIHALPHKVLTCLQMYGRCYKPVKIEDC